MRFSDLLKRLPNVRKLSRKKIAIISTLAPLVVVLVVTAYYYYTTPSTAILFTTADFPAGLSTNFTLDSLTDHVVDRLQKMITIADSNEVTNMARQEGLGSRAVKQTLVPIRALSNAPSPIFNEKWNKWSFNLCRSVGMSFGAKRFLEFRVIGFPERGWRLTAALKESPHFLPNAVGSAPRAGGSCSDFEECADDLTEQILRSLDYRRLLNFYIKQNTERANRSILELYRTTIPKESLMADDLVAWGNAFYGVNKFPEALEKYQEALEKDKNSCSAHAARGFLYYRRPHTGTQILNDLLRAEEDFRAGLVCDPENEYTHASLGHTLLLKWVNSPKHDARLLFEAREQCEKALKINPQFVVAAINVAYILYREGKHKDALLYFDNLSQRYPTNSALSFNYGFLLYREYLKDNSQETLKQATAQTLQSWILNQSSDAANNLGYFYYETGDYEKAVDFWNKANELGNDPDCIAGLALGNYKLGHVKTALKLLARAIQVDAHYSDPSYLKKKRDWSDRTVADLTSLINCCPAKPTFDSP